MIKVENVSKFYSGNGNVALGIHNVSCELHKGEIVAIIGESGSGKSTFLNVVCGIDKFEEGEIYYDGEAVSGFTIAELENFKKNHIGFIFQNYNIIDSFTVIQNVMIPLLLRGKSRKEARAEALEIIDKVGLKGRGRNRGTKLSGGEKQRCVIARALASNSDIIACDEPTGNLDSKTGLEIINLIKEVSKDKLVLIVSHNYEEVKTIATREIRFHDGNIVDDKILVEQDLDEENCLTTEPLVFAEKSKLLVAFTNIISTPKKSILSFLVFFAIAYFVALIVGTMNDDALNISTDTNNYYFNLDETRVLGYDINNEEIDMDAIRSKVTGKIVTNSFFEDRIFYVSLQQFSSMVPLGYIDTGKISVEGRLPKEDNELIVGVSEEAMQDADALIDKNFTLLDYFNNTYHTFSIVGYFEYAGAEEYSSYLYAYGTDVGNAFLKQSVLSTDLEVKSTFFYNELEYDQTLADNVININIKNSNEGLNLSVADAELSITLFDNQIDLSDYLFTYTYNNQSASISMNQNTYDSLFEDHVFQISVYDSNVERSVKQVNAAGYDAYSVISCTENNVFTVILKAFLNFFVVGFSVFGIIVIYFMSYIVLAWIFTSKDKTYTILRTLGCAKKDLSRIVIYETEILCLSSIVLLTIVGFIPEIIGESFLFGGMSISLSFILGFVIIMALLSFLFAIRFNRKLYHFTVQTSLKKEAMKND